MERTVNICFTWQFHGWRRRNNSFTFGQTRVWDMDSTKANHAFCRSRHNNWTTFTLGNKPYFGYFHVGNGYRYKDDLTNSDGFLPQFCTNFGVVFGRFLTTYLWTRHYSTDFFFSIRVTQLHETGRFKLVTTHQVVNFCFHKLHTTCVNILTTDEDGCKEVKFHNWDCDFFDCRRFVRYFSLRDVTANFTTCYLCNQSTESRRKWDRTTLGHYDITWDIFHERLHSQRTMFTDDVWHDFNFFMRDRCSVGDSQTFCNGDHFGTHVFRVASRTLRTLRDSAIKYNGNSAFGFGWFSFTHNGTWQTVFFWEERHKHVCFLGQFGNKGHTHSTWTFNNNWHTLRLSRTFVCSHAEFTEWHFGRRFFNFGLCLCGLLDHHFQLCQCNTSFTLDTSVHHVRCLNSCFNFHHTKERLSKADSYFHRRYGTDCHSNVQWVINCMRMQTRSQEVCCSWGELTGSLTDEGFGSFFHTHFG